ncbi:MAG TPA: efflux RND transporter periplasmic adaptor subunit [Polyangiaceae bacterium]|jgi:RND family efflux transporter MFP subunit
MTQSSESVDKMEPSAGHGEGEVFDPAGYRPTTRALGAVGVATSVVVAMLVLAGVVPRARQRAALETEQAAAALDLPEVQVVPAHRGTTSEPVVLPGTVQPLQETAIYARANGYVRKWYVDIGADVKSGQVLAALDLPDIDEELRQAKATARQAQAGITQAKSQLSFARVTNDRFTALGPSGVVSRQETDQYASAYDVQRANLEAAEAASGSADANVRRIEDLRAFGTIVAPFDGVVTSRSAEIGQLVVSGTGQGQPLFKVAEVDVVRVFVSVPQLYAGGIVPGTTAPVTIREAAGRTFAGKVGRTSKELDTATRSLLVEVDIPNADRALVSGMYAKVAFDVKRQDAPVFVPATSALIDASGTRVAVVRDGVVHWQPVEIEADLGDRLALATGLAEGDNVALTPSERLTEGMRVRAKLPAEAPSKGAPPTPPARVR